MINRVFLLIFDFTLKVKLYIPVNIEKNQRFEYAVILLKHGQDMVHLFYLSVGTT